MARQPSGSRYVSQSKSRCLIWRRDIQPPRPVGTDWNRCLRLIILALLLQLIFGLHLTVELILKLMKLFLKLFTLPEKKNIYISAQSKCHPALFFISLLSAHARTSLLHVSDSVFLLFSWSCFEASAEYLLFISSNLWIKNEKGDAIPALGQKMIIYHHKSGLLHH